MTIHQLKTWPEPFQAIWDGRKRYEVRVNDRNFEVCDELILAEWDPDTERYTGRKVICEVTYITRGCAFGLPVNLCVMSIRADTRHQSVGWIKPT